MLEQPRYELGRAFTIEQVQKQAIMIKELYENPDWDIYTVDTCRKSLFRELSLDDILSEEYWKGKSEEEILGVVRLIWGEYWTDCIVRIVDEDITERIVE